MTATSPTPGMTARRRRGAAAYRGSRRRAWIARLAVLAAAVLLMGTAAPAIAATTPTPTVTPTAGTGVTFTLAPISDGVVSTDGPLTASLTVTNDTSLLLFSGSLHLELGRTRLADRATLLRWLGGDTEGVTTREVATADADAVEPHSSRTVGITVPADEKALAGLTPGIYPLLARYQRAGGDLVSTSVVIVPRAGQATSAVGIVVPITAPALTTGLLTSAQLAELTAPGGALAEQLAAVTGSTAILAIDPAIPAAIRVLGSAAPASAIEWLDALLALPNTRFALQFGDADVAAQVAAGLSEPLRPSSLQVYMTEADFPTVTPTPETTPAPTEQPETPDYPTLDELLDIGTTRDQILWPAGGSADDATVTALGALGDDDPALTLLSSAAVAASGGATSARGATDAGAHVLVYDADVSAALSEAAATTENALRGRPLAAATALLSLTTDAAGSAPVLVTADRDAVRSRVALRAAILAATVLESTRAATLDDLVDATPQSVAVKGGADAERTAAATRLRDGETDLAAFATILDDPTVITGRERAEILQLLGAGWHGDPAWGEALTAHREATTRTLGSVGIRPASHINLATTGAGLPLWVRNDLGYPVNVTLYATPDDLRLEVRRVNDVSAGAASNTRVEVPVRAQVGSGEVTIALALRSPTGVQIGPDESVDVTVRAEWEGIGVGVILTLVGGLIVVGLVRTILRRRRTQSDTTDGARR